MPLLTCQKVHTWYVRRCQEGAPKRQDAAVGADFKTWDIRLYDVSSEGGSVIVNPVDKQSPQQPNFDDCGPFACYALKAFGSCPNPPDEGTTLMGWSAEQGPSVRKAIWSVIDGARRSMQ
jgi:hypothetical protein